MNRRTFWIFVACMSLILCASTVYCTPAQIDGLADMLYLNTAQYYCLAAVLKDILIRDPSLSDPFGMSAITELGIMDPSFAEVFDNKQMMVKDKLSATIKLMTMTPYQFVIGASSDPRELPPYTKQMSAPAYANLKFN